MAMFRDTAGSTDSIGLAELGIDMGAVMGAVAKSNIENKFNSVGATTAAGATISASATFESAVDADVANFMRGDPNDIYFSSQLASPDAVAEFVPTTSVVVDEKADLQAQLQARQT